MIENHFTATGIVFNDKREILMIHHRKLQVWLPPGGHVDKNELPDDAVLREVHEETHIQARIIDTKQGCSWSSKHCKELKLPFVILLEDINGDGTHNHIDMIYLCTAIGGELKQQKKEVDGIGWFSLEQIKELKTYGNVINTISQAVNYLNENPIQ